MATPFHRVLFVLVLSISSATVVHAQSEADKTAIRAVALDFCQAHRET